MSPAQTIRTCRPAVGPVTSNAAPWQRRPMTQILAALAGFFPLLALSYWMYGWRDETMTIHEMLLGPLLGGGCLIVWVLFLHVYVSGDRIERLGFRARGTGADIGLGAALAVAFLAFQFLYNASVAPLFPATPPPEEMLKLISGLSRNPLYLALWLGPVVWIGVAGFEELLRAFALRRLWLGWPGLVGRWGTILVVSSVIGLAHGYQGPAAILSIGIQSVVMGWFYMVTGRIRALIVAHALYDSIQIMIIVTMIHRSGL